MAAPDRQYLFGPFRLDPVEGLFRGGETIPLRPKPLLLLTYFARHPGRVLSTSTILSDIWTDTTVDARGLKVYVSQLRRALGDDPASPAYIETLPKRGYRFKPVVRVTPSAGAQEPALEVVSGPEEPDRADWRALTSPAEPASGPPQVEASRPRGGPAPHEWASDTFVGRELELGHLEQVVREVRVGAGRLVFITGGPGIGKTTLAHELLSRVARRGTPVLISRGRCVEQYGPKEAYLPFLDALGALLAGPDRARVTAALQAHAPTWCLQLPATCTSMATLAHLMRETVGATKDRMQRELGDALGALTAEVPLILLLEDLHWADASSIDLLRHLALRLAGQRLLLLVTFRPEDVERTAHPLKDYRAEMVARTPCEELQLTELSLEDVGHYLDARFPDHELPPALAEFIHERSEGHPLFAASLVQFLVERRDIAPVDNIWRLVRPLTGRDLQAPEGVRSVIRRQIDALEEEDRRALQYASVEGEEFLTTIVAHLTGINELLLEERLQRLERVNRLIRTVGEEELPDGALAIRYRFTHALHQSVLYDDLVSRRRMLLHREAGEQWLRHYGGQAHRIAARLAVHFDRGRDFARAVEFRIHSGDNAARMLANAEAERHYTEALRLVTHLPACDRPRQEMAIYRKRGTVHLNLSRFDQALTDFRAMRALASAAADPATEAAALNGMTRALFYAHRLDDTARTAEEALRTADRSGDATVRLEALTLIGLKRLGQGELREAKPLLDETIADARRLDHAPSLCASLAWRGALHYWQSEYDKADRALTEARHLAAALQDGFLLLFSLFIQGLTRGNQGRMSDALDCLAEASRIAERNGDRFWSSRLPNCIGWIYRELQDFHRAVQHDRQGFDLGGARHVLEVQANALINLGLDYTELREPKEKSMAAFREVHDIFARDAWFRWRYNIRLQAAAAEHWLRHGELAQATEHAERLAATAADYEAWKYVANAGLLFARIAHARGNGAAALDHLARATAQLEQHPAPLVDWRVSAMVSRLEMMRGRPDLAAAAADRSARLIRSIAGSVRDDALRATFLGSPAVREIITPTGSPLSPHAEI